MLHAELHCLRCGMHEEITGKTYLCKRCGPGDGPSDAGVLDVKYDYQSARQRLFNGRTIIGDVSNDLFRFLPLLPLDARGPVPPVGATPLYEAAGLAGSGGASAIYLKDETRNPTRVLKDRATAIGISRAHALGFEDLFCASSGNAAISLAGLCAFAGVRAHVFVPHNASPVRLKWLHRFKADIHRSTGDYDTAFDEAEQMRAHGWYSRNCAFNPFLIEGKKTAGLEIAEQLDWKVPDLVVCPVGDGCTLAAVGKAFRELAEMGVTDRLPRLIGIQSSAIQPVVNRMRQERGEKLVEQETISRTAAASIDVKYPRNVRRLLQEIKVSNGMMIAVGEDSIAAAQRELAERAGLVAEFTSAAALAGLWRLGELESLDRKSAVLVITGGRPDDA